MVNSSSQLTESSGSDALLRSQQFDVSQIFGWTCRMRTRMDARVRMHDLTGFHDLLEPAQVTLHLLLRFLSEELRDPRSQPAAGWLILELDHHLSAAVARGIP